MVFAALEDVVWVTLSIFSIEAPKLWDFLHVSMQQAPVTMTYSHNLVPVAGMVVASFAAALTIHRQPAVALWCAALVIGHFVCDLVSGYPHFLLHDHDHAIGLGLYRSHPFAALAIETALSFACVRYFIGHEAAKHRPVASRTRWLLYAAFVGGSLALLPVATRSLLSWL